MTRLGDTLQERRRQLGISLEQAQQATRIRARLLTALENGEYDLLPNPGYVRGYISSYARYLELDPVPLLNIYKAESGARRQDLDLPQISEAVAKTGEQHAVPGRIAIALVAGVVVIALVIWIGARLARGPQDTPPEPATTEATQTGDPASDDADADTEENLPEETPLQPFTLKVVVDEDSASWVRVSVDGKTAYEGTLAGGQSKSFEVAEAATVRIGKPSVVTVTRDGKNVKIPKGDTPVVELEATAPE